MNLGNNILKSRKKLQFSQEQLGDIVGVTRQTISNWELNETIPNTKQLVALSKALQISIDELVDNEVQTSLEQNIYDEVRKDKNKKSSKTIIVLSFVLALFIIAFIMAN